MYHISITERVPGLPTTIENIPVESKEEFNKKIKHLYSNYEGDELSYSKLIDLIREGNKATLEIDLYLNVGENRYHSVEQHSFLMSSSMISDLKNKDS